MLIWQLCEKLEYNSRGSSFPIVWYVGTNASDPIWVYLCRNNEPNINQHILIKTLLYVQLPQSDENIVSKLIYKWIIRRVTFSRIIYIFPFLRAFFHHHISCLSIYPPFSSFILSYISFNAQIHIVHIIVPSLSTGPIFQDPQWVSELSERTQPYIYYFSYTYIPVIKFNM